ncbi:competence protein CoiA [Jeotgalibacillus campisalis]|uniref:Competence protein CoiA n=1 Tax=Jeotgalibacillus campisalis TaxID=220754 RepID=A0A0C2VSK9_9BACL|nr:competence protein CoiA family protein [Jeotgalibacillus campisalis]KIL47416.1 hypothetical protein KR50_15830 [Jeotgalibacillus campisalis]
MLIARNQSGQLLFLDGSSSKDELRKLRNRPYFCLQCSEKVIMKVGDVKIPHFSHQSTKVCRGFSEPESPEHIEAKLQLYNWLRKSSIEAEIEKIYPKFKQRADIGVRFLNKEYAIEFQRSRISLAQFAKRTTEYTVNDIVPVWLLSYDVLSKPVRNKISFSAFHQQFIRYSPFLKQFYLLSYDHVQQSFRTFNNLLPLTKSTFLFSGFSHSLEKIQFPNFPLQPYIYSSKDLKAHQDHRSSWLETRLAHGRGCMDELLNTFYQQRVNLQLIPPWVGIPVRHSVFIKEPDPEWQAYLYLLFLNDTINSDPLSVDFIFKKMKEYVDRTHLNMRFIHPYQLDGLETVVTDYLYMLEKIGVIVKNQNGFILSLGHPFAVIKHVSDMNEMKAQFWRKYQGIILESLNK